MAQFCVSSLDIVRGPSKAGRSRRHVRQSRETTNKRTGATERQAGSESSETTDSTWPSSDEMAGTLITGMPSFAGAAAAFLFFSFFHECRH
jgi:hypothetical protein